jgi:hypothetical protein
MMGSYTDAFLRKLRNEIDINLVIQWLRVETRASQKILRFRCPLCHGFHTATNAKTNLARCFDCRRNFNPIDLVMTVTARSFVQTVEFLKDNLPDAPTS